jgi:hypothetical protein
MLQPLSTQPITVVLNTLHKYQSFSIRTIHTVLENSEGVHPHAIFFKNHYTNDIIYPTSKVEKMFAEKIRDPNPRFAGLSGL